MKYISEIVLGSIIILQAIGGIYHEEKAYAAIEEAHLGLVQCTTAIEITHRKNVLLNEILYGR